MARTQATDHESSVTLARDGVALWRRIAGDLRRRLQAGEWAPGARLPTEAQLSTRFAVNRHTVRRALDELVRDGLVRVEQGRGAFATEDLLDYLVEPRTRFSAWIRRNSKEPSSQTLEIVDGEADAAISAALGIPVGKAVVWTDRLGFADGRPVALGRHVFDPARLPGIAAALRTESSITAALCQAGVSDYVRHSTRVTARMPTAQEAVLLRTARNLPLLVCENVNVDLSGQPIEYCLARYPTPRVQVVFEP